MPKPVKKPAPVKVIKKGKEINVKELLAKLDAVAPGLSKKEILEQATHYIFSGERIITYNDKISVSTPYTDITESFSVKAEDFYKILKGISEETAHLQLKDNMIIITTDTTEAELAITTEETTVIELYKSLDIENQKPKKLKDPAEFITALDFCKFCASKDLTADALFCVCIEGTKVMAADDIRVSVYTLKEKLPKILIPATMLGELTTYPLKEYAVAESWTHFFMENGTAFSCRTVDDDYPDMETFLKETTESEEVTPVALPSDLKNILDAVIPMCKGDSDMEKTVEVSYNHKDIVLVAEKETGKLKKTVKYNSGVDVAFMINPIFLKDIMNKCDSFNLLADKSVIHFSTGPFNHIISVEIPEE